MEGELAESHPKAARAASAVAVPQASDAYAEIIPSARHATCSYAQMSHGWELDFPETIHLFTTLSPINKGNVDRTQRKSYGGLLGVFEPVYC